MNTKTETLGVLGWFIVVLLAPMFIFRTCVVAVCQMIDMFTLGSIRG